jgi:hypothetical protein
MSVISGGHHVMGELQRVRRVRGGTQAPAWASSLSSLSVGANDCSVVSAVSLTGHQLHVLIDLHTIGTNDRSQSYQQIRSVYKTWVFEQSLSLSSRRTN